MNLIRTAMVLALACVGCGGGGGGGCRTVGEACTATTDCYGNYVCQNGACTTASACCSAGQSCTAPTDCCGSTLTCGANNTCVTVLPNGCPSDAPIACMGALAGNCCPSATPVCCTKDSACHTTQADCNGSTCASAGQACGSGCCAGLTCQGGKCATPMMGCGGKACTDSTNCCANYVCSRYGHTCIAAMNLKMLDPCTANNQCLPNLCYSGITGNDGATGNSWCSFACTKDADCGGAGYCILDTLGHYRCFPFCNNNNTDCTVYGPAITCKMGTDISGLNLPACSG